VTALFCSAATIIWPAAAQTQEPQLIQPHSGFQLDSVSAFTAYYSDGFAANLVPLQSAALAPDVAMGAAATLSWNNVTERSNVSVTYTADYSGRVRYSSWDALNHRLSMNAARHLTPLWEFRFALGAGVSTSDQLVLLNGELSGAAPVSASLLLFGERSLSATALMSLSYKLSSRTSLAWHVGGTRYQSLAGNDAAAQAGVVSLLSQSTTASAGFDVSHSLSPRTQVGLTFGTNRLISGFLDAWSQSGIVFLNRALSQRWFAAVRGGGGFVHPLQREVNLTSAPQYLAGGNLGYKTPANTLQVSFDRTVGDTYGLGAATTVSGFASWTWAQPGSPWSLRASVGEQQLEHGVLPTVRTRQMTFSIGRAINRNLQLMAEYGYMQYSGGALFGSISPTAVRLAMVWRPGPGLLH
jgi:hypothetical protein